MAIGEVYVLNDGGEVDLDLGNYERYLDVTLSRDNNITTGKIYKQVIEREVSALTAFVLARFNSFSSSTTAKRRISGQDGSGHPACDRCDSGLDRAGRQNFSRRVG